MLEQLASSVGELLSWLSEPVGQSAFDWLTILALTVGPAAATFAWLCARRSRRRKHELQSHQDRLRDYRSRGA